MYVITIVFPVEPAVTCVGVITAFPCPIGVAVTVSVHVGVHVGVGVDVDVAVAAIIFTCGEFAIGTGFIPVGSLDTVNTTMPTSLAMPAVAPGPPPDLAPYVTVIVPGVAPPGRFLTFTTIFWPLATVEYNVPPDTLTVKYPGSVPVKLGALQSAGIVIINSP